MKGLDYVQTASKEDKFQFNGGSEFEKKLSLNFIETPHRLLDVQLGRFVQTDKLVDLFTGITPYVYAYNNPIKFNDPTGLCTDCATDENDFTDLAEKYAVKASRITVTYPIIENLVTYTKEVRRELEPHLRPDNVNKNINRVIKKVDTTIDDKDKLKYLPIGYLLIKAWGLYGKQILLYGSAALSSALYGIVSGGGDKYAFGFEYQAISLADEIGGEHLMSYKGNWKEKFLEIISNPNNEIHFSLDNIDESVMQMIQNPLRSSTNWEISKLYETGTFYNTIFHYQGQIYIGAESFKIQPYKF